MSINNVATSANDYNCYFNYNAILIPKGLGCPPQVASRQGG